MKLGGALAARESQPLGRYCPMERALGVVNTRSAILILREAFYGATRFEEFTARAGQTDATTATKLRDMVDAGILEKRPYQDPGHRRRHEYVLTQSGADLMPMLFALLQWGNQHDPPPYPPVLTHDGCGETVAVVTRCEAGHEVGPDDVIASAPGPFGLTNPRLP
jgi:DNA-binding HxlR family transcriptional regulator